MFVSNAEIQLREMRNPREQTQIQFFSFSFVAITSKEFSEKFWFLNSMLDAQWFFGCRLERIVYTFYCIGPDFELHEWTRKKNQFTLHRVFPNIFHFTLIFIHWFTDEGIMNVHIKFIARSTFCLPHSTHFGGCVELQRWNFVANARITINVKRFAFRMKLRLFCFHASAILPSPNSKWIQWNFHYIFTSSVRAHTYEAAPLVLVSHCLCKNIFHRIHLWWQSGVRWLLLHPNP